MKKLMILATCAAIAAVACTKIHEVTPVTQGPAIGLGTWTNTLTKAYDGTWVGGESFSAFGTKTIVATTSSVFEDVPVTSAIVSAVTTWTYSPVQYWDVTANNYTFYAFLPFVDGNTDQANDLLDFTDGDVPYSNNGQFQTTEITFSNPAGNDQDILVATKYSRDKGASSMATDDVQLAFNHMTSMIDVKAKKDASLDGLAGAGQNVKVSVTDVKLAAIKDKGTFKVTGYSGTPAKPTYTGTYGWTPTPATPHTTDYVVIDSSSDAPVVLGSKTTYNASGVATSTTPSSVDDLLTSYILMPQELVDNGQQLVLSYKIQVFNDADPSTPVSTATYTDVPVDFHDFIRTDRIDNTDTLIPGWKPGYHYTYTVTIGAKPIIFGSVSVNAWIDEDPGYYYIVR